MSSRCGLLAAALLALLDPGCTADPATLSQPSGAPLACGAGTVLVDGVCAVVDADAGVGVRCGAGTELVDGLCVTRAESDAGGGVVCGAGTELVGGTCVPVAGPDAGPAVACGAGTELVGGACVPVGQPDAGGGVVCGAGTELVGGACVPVAGPDAGRGVVCGAGTELVDGACVPVAQPDAGPPVACGPGTAEVDGVCVPEGGACQGDDDCPRGLYCIQGGCRERICEPAARRCSGRDIEVCDRHGLGWDFRRVCEHGCAQGECQAPAPVCQPGARRCSDEEVEVCAADGLSWEFRRACPTGCDRGECRDPACEPFSRRCNGLIPQQCDAWGSAWQDGAPCQSSCFEGQCDRLPPGGCPPGTARCDGDTREVCSDQFLWEVAEVCGGACLSGRCVECRPGLRRCGEGDVEVCAAEGDTWLPEEACGVGCLHARCTVCEPIARRCNGDVVEVCDAEGQGWEAASLCLTACRRGACTACRPADLRCRGRTVERCIAEGIGWEPVEDCAGACEGGACLWEPVCVPGARRCAGDEVEVCTADGLSWEFRRACQTPCSQGSCAACRPGARRCNGRTVELCVEDGSGWEVAEACEGPCADGACRRQVCEPATRRCRGQDVEVCTPDGEAWMVVQSCMDRCEVGACEGPACLPFTLSATPAVLPPDGSSSALVVSDLLLDVHGEPVPDGSLFTIVAVGAGLLAADGDPNTPGVQVRSLNGRVDFGVQAAEEPGEATIRALHPVAGHCLGEAGLPFEVGAPVAVALDFTDDGANDTELTTALWDTMLGRLDPFPSDFGGGQDGDLEVGGDYNINRDAQPGRLFPDAVNFVVTEVGEASATVRGGVGGVEIGDEVLLINLQGDQDNHDNTGNYEIKEVARISYGENTLFFTTSLEKVYGATDGNDVLAGQQIMLQRVPRYRSLRVTGTLTADSWDGEKGGVLFIKVLGSVEVLGTVDMDGKGYRYRDNQQAESYSGPGEVDTAANGGGGGRDDSVLEWPSTDCHRRWLENIAGAGGGYGTAGTSVGPWEAGQPYGTPDLAQWFLGSGGSGRQRRARHCNCGCNNQEGSWDGSHGGGLLVVWASGISVRGGIRARQQQSQEFRGSGGTVFLRARSMNVGGNRVKADGGSNGGDGRVRLDFFGLSGTTLPDHFSGFGGDTVVVTAALDDTDAAIASATLLRAVADERGGTLAYRATNDGGQNWHDLAPGDTVDFPAQESDLRLEVSFSNDNLEPLTLNGIVLGYSAGAGP